MRFTSAKVSYTFVFSLLAPIPRSLAQKQRCSSTVRIGQRISNWGQTPISRCTLSIWFLIEKPPTRAFPLLGEKMPVIMESKVVLPAPLGPRSPKIVLSSTIRLKLFTASFPFLYLLLMPLQMRGQSPTFQMAPIWMHSSSMVESLSCREVSFCSTQFYCCLKLSMMKQRGNRRDCRTPNYWGTTS